MTNPIALCAFGPCDRLAKVKGLCTAHYKQRWSGKPLTPLRGRSDAAYRITTIGLDDLIDRIADAVIERLRAEGIVPESPNRGP